MRGDSVSVSAAAYHHNGVADQAVKLELTIVRNRHLTLEVHGSPVVVLYCDFLLGATLYVNKLLSPHTDWMLDVWYVTRHHHLWQRGG